MAWLLGNAVAYAQRPGERMIYGRRGWLLRIAAWAVVDLVWAAMVLVAAGWLLATGWRLAG